METKEKVNVRLTTSGIYRVSPFKAEYKKAGEYETLSVVFSVELGFGLSCWQNKTIFFKDSVQINEEIQFLLKFIAPNLLGKKYNVATFKEYADALCADINTELLKNRESGNRIVLNGKILRKKGSNYIEFEDYIPPTGDFRKSYLAHVDDYRSQWFSKWELDNCEVPFIQTTPRNNTPEPVVVDAFSQSISNDDLPF